MTSNQAKKHIMNHNHSEKLREVVLDTSYLLLCLELRIDPIESLIDAADFPLNPLVPVQVVRELENLATKGGLRQRIYAKLALRYLESRRISVVNIGELRHVDKALLAIAHARGAYIATADMELARTARSMSIPVFVIRVSKRKVELIS